MITKAFSLFSIFLISLFLVGCGDRIDVVDAGTYPGSVEKVVPDEREIYVALADGRRLELYFTDTTELLADGQPAPFSKLQEGIAVNVTVEREGNRNVPVRVEIVP